MSSESSENASITYIPVNKHWFYQRTKNKTAIWTPFSQGDSNLLEQHFVKKGNAFVTVEGGRYDVNINERQMSAIYWKSTPQTVRRCSWFKESVGNKFEPYDEHIAERLEEGFRQAVLQRKWMNNITVSETEYVVMHDAATIVHYERYVRNDAWGGEPRRTLLHMIVRRGMHGFRIPATETAKVDHLLLMVHGIGSGCDIYMRPIEDVVDDFRRISKTLIRTHYSHAYESGKIGRIEVLPISWSGYLHAHEKNIDEQLRTITLPSIPLFRSFTNTALLDILFYTSPKFCQTILDTVADEINLTYTKYCQRNTQFKGGVSLAGHSLGALILFDLLGHQKPHRNLEKERATYKSQYLANSEASLRERRFASSYAETLTGTGQPLSEFVNLIIEPQNFFALGSPIGVFVTIRGIDKLEKNFHFPTCPGFFNIYHPYDPVAFRVEPLINTDMKNMDPVLITHHKGRKRLHLELQDTFTRLGTNLKERVLDTLKSALDKIPFWGSYRQREQSRQQPQLSNDVASMGNLLQSHVEYDAEEMGVKLSESHSTVYEDPLPVKEELNLGRLNNYRRIDYVLQEAPLEYFSGYLFMMSSHMCYWQSQDTILFIVKEIYMNSGIQSDDQE